MIKESDYLLLLLSCFSCVWLCVQHLGGTGASRCWSRGGWTLVGVWLGRWACRKPRWWLTGQVPGLKEWYSALVILTIRHIFLAPDAVIVHREGPNGPVLIIQATQQASLLLQAVGRNPTVLGCWQVFLGFRSHLGSSLIPSDLADAFHSSPASFPLPESLLV